MTSTFLPSPELRDDLDRLLWPALTIGVLLSFISVIGAFFSPGHGTLPISMDGNECTKKRYRPYAQMASTAAISIPDAAPAACFAMPFLFNFPFSCRHVPSDPLSAPPADRKSTEALPVAQNKAAQSPSTESSSRSIALAQSLVSAGEYRVAVRNSPEAKPLTSDISFPLR